VALVQNRSEHRVGPYRGSVGLPALDSPHHQVSVLVIQRDHRQLGLGQLAGALSQEVHRGPLVPALEEQLGHRPGGLQPPPLLPAALVQAGIVDGDASRRREGHQDRFVVCGEVRVALLLGQIEVAEDFVPNPNRRTKEGVHRWVVGRKTVGVGVVGEVVQPPRPRFTDQQTEHAMPTRQVPDRLALPLAEPLRHELHEVLAVLAKHAQRAILRVDELTGRTHDPVEDIGQLEVGRDRHHGVQEGSQTLLGSVRSPPATA